MKFLAALSLVILAACAGTPSATAPIIPPSPNALNGTWDVAMLYAPDQPPSATVMELSLSPDGVLTGSFYESPFEEAEYSVRGNVIAFGAVTSDGKAPYAHSGRLVDGKIEGQTLSFGRDFLMIWTATRRDDRPVAENK
tara:strand:+ start:657 stop:1073 length:417 start_codon:yes stop_codon:yes gene_type:complete